eukprot:gene16329-biopygen3759
MNCFFPPVGKTGSLHKFDRGPSFPPPVGKTLSNAQGWDRRWDDVTDDTGDNGTGCRRCERGVSGVRLWAGRALGACIG